MNTKEYIGKVEEEFQFYLEALEDHKDGFKYTFQDDDFYFEIISYKKSVGPSAIPVGSIEDF